MNRKIIGICAVAMVLLNLTGCASSVSGKPQSGSSSVESSPEGAAGTISPLPVDVDMADLTGTVAVSFDRGDAYVDDTGKMQLKVMVYTYDTYAPEDIAAMEVGDTLILRGETIQVTALERDAAGAVVLNGGLDAGGYELITDQNGVYFATDYDDLKLYYEIGEATLPVSQDFLFEDSADLDRGTQTRYPGDFITDEAGIEYDFTPNNTTITIVDGYVVSMERVYNP